MKKIILSITLVALLGISAHAQDETRVEQVAQLERLVQQLQTTDSVAQNEFQQLKNRDNTLQSSISSLSRRNGTLSSRLDSLTALLSQNSQAISALSQQLTAQQQELSGQISETRATTSQSVSELDKALNKNTLYWIIAVLAVGILSILAFFLLRKKVTDNQSSINQSLANTRQELEQEGIRLDEKLVGVMETQMKIIQEERKAAGSQNEEQDHSLALKVADEIVRIEKNISQMDEGTRGLKQLAKAVGRIRDNFASNGYEMVDMIGKSFDDGMKVTANFRPDDNLDPDQKIITRIIKPQVNYKGKMVQSAQVEVSQGA
jgi:hypothetical protein